VNLGRERGPYTQLCSWIEISAIQLLHAGKIENTRIMTDSSEKQEAGDYLRLIEALQVHPDLKASLQAGARTESSSRWLFLIKSLFARVFEWLRNLGHHKPSMPAAAPSARPQPVGKSFYPPGDAVTEQYSIFAAVTLERLQSLAPSIPAEQMAPYVELAQRKAEFYRDAHGRQSGVIEVLATVPI